jgi:putative addiction module killer protein
LRQWFDGLDAAAAAKIAIAVSRLELGNTSNVKWIGAIGECRINWGPGYRLYLAKDGEAVIVLLGGTKPAGRHKPRAGPLGGVSGSQGTGSAVDA